MFPIWGLVEKDSPLNKGATWLKGAIPLLALILINVICFSRTLNGYFLADDFVHVAFLHRVFQGHPELLWQNFYTNWMQTQGTQFYRPLISLTLALDYLLYGAQGWGFHLSNTVYQILSSIFLYFFTRRLLRGTGTSCATWAAFFTAALFSAFPLHCEVVSWIVGRVDSVCTTFYFAGLWLFMRWYQDKGKLSLILSLVSFILSLCSKEMAITLPPVLFLICFMEAAGSLKQRVLEALKASWIFWAVLCVYLGMRTVFLGTVSGGYTGSIGEGLSQSLYSRWFGGESFSKVLYPLNEEAFAGDNKLRKVLRLIYTLVGSFFVLRLAFFKKLNPFNKYFAFAIAWFVLAMVPTYQVFNITQNLQGSRFIYLGSAPLCLFIVLLVMPLVQGFPLRSVQGVGRLSSYGLLGALLICFAQITYKNNISWAHASNELRDFRQAIENETAKLKPEQKLIIFNLPQRNSGAHMLYNAAMLSVLLEPPLSPAGISGKVVTFEPMTYGDSGLIIVSRLRKLLRQPSLYSGFEWDSEKHALVPVVMESRGITEKILLSSNMEFDTHNTTSGNNYSENQYASAYASPVPSRVSGNLCLDSGPIDLDCLDVDFIDVELSYKRDKPEVSKPYVMLFWANEKEPLFDGKRILVETIEEDSKFQKCRFTVSQHKNWIESGSVKWLRLAWAPGDYKLTVRKITAVTGGIALLETKPGSFVEEIDGVYRLLSSKGVLNYDVSSIPQAIGCIVEVSKPNSWFEHYSGHYRETSLSGQALKVLPLYKSAPASKGQFAIEQNMFPISGYYQVRVAAVNQNGNVVGYVSDPVNMQVAVEGQSHE